MNIFELAAKLILDSSEYEDGINKAEKKGRGLGKSLKGALGTISKISMGAVGAAATGIGAIVKQSVDAFGSWEQLKGGAEKIFAGMNMTKILNDAKNAYKDLNMSQTQYIEAMNLAGATFAQTMGAEKGYDTARKGMKAIADFASGTGKSIDLLNEKYQLITRSASGYQGIADQFAGILPQTTADFLKEAQAANILSKRYKKLTDVPIAEYQQAVTEMIKKGVDAQNLLNNTAEESEKTLTGSFAMTKAAWQNLVAGFADPEADIGDLIDRFIQSGVAAINNIVPTVERAMNGIEKAVKVVAPKIGKTAVKLISDNAPKIIKSAINMISGFTDAIFENADGIVDAIGDILDIATDALLSPNGVTKLIDGFSKLFSKVIGNIGDIDTGELVKGAVDIIGHLATALSNNVSELLPAVAKLIGDLALNLTNPDNLKTLFGGAGDIITGIGDGLLKAAPDLIQKVPKILDNVVQGIEQGLPAFAGKIAGLLVNAIKTIFSPENINLALLVTSIFTGNWGGVSLALSQGFSGEGKNAGKEFVDAFKETVGSFNVYTADSGAEHRSGGGKWDAEAESANRAAEAVGKVADAAEKAETAVTRMGRQRILPDDAADGVTNQLDNAVSKAAAATAAIETTKEKAVSAGNTVSEAMNKAQATVSWDTLIKSSQTASEAVQEAFENAPEWFGKQFNLVVENIKAAIAPLPDEFAAIWELIKTRFRVSEAQTWGRDMIRNFTNGVNELKPELIASIEDLALKVKAILGHSHPTEGPMKDDHKWMPDMMSLFIKGIEDNENRLHSTAARAFDLSGSFTAPDMTFSEATTGAVSPLEAKLDQLLTVLNAELPQLANRQVVLDTGAVVGGILPQVDAGLGRRYEYAGRDNA